MKIFSFLAGAAALVLTAGCAFSEFKTTSAPVTDPRISFIENGGFSLKPLNVVTKIDDEAERSKSLLISRKLHLWRPFM